MAMSTREGAISITDKWGREIALADAEKVIFDEYPEACECGHGPRAHRHVPAQYKRPDSDPCDECDCMQYFEVLAR